MTFGPSPYTKQQNNGISETENSKKQNHTLSVNM